MAITRELWISAIEDNLYASLNKVLPAAIDDSSYLHAKTVHIPNAGTGGTVLKNPSRPLTVGERTDIDHTYDIDEWVMPPSLVKFAEMSQLSYDKLQSLVNDIMGGIGESILRGLLVNWYTDATYRVQTSGSNYTGHAPGATGNRKGLVLADLMAAAKALDAMNFPTGDRFLIVDTTMLYQLIETINITAYRDAALINASTLDLPPVAGFKVLSFPHVAYVTSANVIRAVGHAGAATDNAVALAVHKSALSFAVGDINVFTSAGDAIYAGDVVSGAALAGGKYRRADKKGVIPIIQAAP